MKNVDLRKESSSMSRLLAMARQDPVMLISEDATTYLLEEADELYFRGS